MNVKRKKMGDTEKFANVKAAAEAVTGKTADNDCAVKAITLTTGRTYKAVYAACKKAGRVDGEGTPLKVMKEALNSFGFKAVTVDPKVFISKYPKSKQNKKQVTTYQPARFPDAWKDNKRYILITCNHAAAVIDGTVHDFSNDESRQVKTIWRIEKVSK